MKNRVVPAGLFALGLLAMPAAWAQSIQRPSEAPTRITDIPNERKSTAQDIQVESLTAQELRAKPVYDTKGEKIATIKDVTGTPGQSRQAILQTGGLLGVGGREVALPLSKLSMAPDGRLMLTMTQDELDLLPRYQ